MIIFQIMSQSRHLQFTGESQATPCKVIVGTATRHSQTHPGEHNPQLMACWNVSKSDLDEQLETKLFQKSTWWWWWLQIRGVITQFV